MNLFNYDSAVTYYTLRIRIGYTHPTMFIPCRCNHRIKMLINSNRFKKQKYIILCIPTSSTG